MRAQQRMSSCEFSIHTQRQTVPQKCLVIGQITLSLEVGNVPGNHVFLVEESLLKRRIETFDVIGSRAVNLIGQSDQLIVPRSEKIPRLFSAELSLVRCLKQFIFLLNYACVVCNRLKISRK